MNLHVLTVKRSLSFRWVLLGAGVLLASCDEQPEPQEACFVQDGAPWQVKYDLLEAPAAPACAGKGRPPGETLTVDQLAHETGEQQLFLDWGPEVLHPESRGYEPASAWLSAVDDQRLCTADSFSVGGLGYPRLVPNPPSPAEWPVQFQLSDVKVYVPPGRLGDQLSGVLTYTEDGCTWRYAMRAIFPAVACDPALDPEDPAHAARTCGAGSGIDPAMAVVCDPRLSACVPAGPIPSLK
jgi:hypothetical protein